MIPKTDYDVVIVGGGLAGLISALSLSKSGYRILLIEKKSFPFNKVCGEYISNEVLGLLKSLGFDPFRFGASAISKLRISTPTGKNIYTDLDLGGFGLSRFVMDKALLDLVKLKNVEVRESTKVTDIIFADNQFDLKLASGEIVNSKLVVGSYGKRDSLDKKLNRKFIANHTGFMGVKYHVRTDYPVNEIGLDNFENGYCGIVKIEENKYNICYLYKRSNGYSFSTVQQLEEEILFKNPRIKNIFKNAEFIFKDAEVINEISFSKKSVVENHTLMCGDAAGLITPLCGNGMAMAIHSAKILSDIIIDSSILKYKIIPIDLRISLENNYTLEWNKQFKRRLSIGRTIQQFFGNPLVTGFFLNSIHAIPPLEKFLIKSTHGQILKEN